MQPDRTPSAARNRGPVHEVDAGRYYAEVVDGIPMIFRADTVGAVTHIETADVLADENDRLREIAKTLGWDGATWPK